MNPVFDRFMQSIPLPGPLQNIANVLSQFDQFSNSFQGDPRQQVQELLSSGRMTNEQYAQFQSWANRIYPLLKRR